MALTNFLTTDKALASVLNDRVVTPANTHINSTSNPHSVTKTQVGLSNVTNDEQIPKSIIDAAGDLIYGTADNTPARLAKGADGQVLYINSGNLSWTDKSKIATGTYAGNAVGARNISVGFIPDFVFIWSSSSKFWTVANDMGYTIMIQGGASSTAYSVKISTTDGFKVGSDDINANGNGTTYNYKAIKV